MSDATPNREWRFYLDDMIGFCERVHAFTSGLDQSRFVNDVMRFACYGSEYRYVMTHGLLFQRTLYE